NVLVTGPNDALAPFLEMARGEMREPIRSTGHALPPLLDGFHTLVITEIELLDAADQQRLRRWFEERRNPDVQVVSLTSAPLFAIVMAHAFDADLYYRLNTIYLELQSA
ncbi:MAG: sigma 54-interacting transcriptional regulator, partial [Thermoanaerobaculia bacterium]